MSEQDIHVVISQAVRLSAAVGGYWGTRICSGKCLFLKSSCEMCAKRGTKDTKKKPQAHIYFAKGKQLEVGLVSYHIVTKSNQKWC